LFYFRALKQQNVEAKSLLLALKTQWSNDCEVLLKERENAVKDHYTKELNNYREEVKIKIVGIICASFGL